MKLSKLSTSSMISSIINNYPARSQRAYVCFISLFHRLRSPFYNASRRSNSPRNFYIRLFGLVGGFCNFRHSFNQKNRPDYINKKTVLKSHDSCASKCCQIVNNLPEGQHSVKVINDLSTRSRSDCPQSSIPLLSLFSTYSLKDEIKNLFLAFLSFSLFLALFFVFIWSDGLLLFTSSFIDLIVYCSLSICLISLSFRFRKVIASPSNYHGVYS